MTRRIGVADVEGLEVRGTLAERRRSHVQRGELFERWATDDAFELEDGLRKAQTLIAAAEQYALADDPERALAALRLAEAQADALPNETAGSTVSALLALGRHEEALAVADAVRRDRDAGWQLLWEVAEAFEHGGELQLAERWFTIALRVQERLGQSVIDQRELLLTGRYRVRRDAGKPADLLDLEASRLRVALGYGPLDVD